MCRVVIASLWSNIEPKCLAGFWAMSHFCIVIRNSCRRKNLNQWIRLSSTSGESRRGSSVAKRREWRPCIVNSPLDRSFRISQQTGQHSFDTAIKSIPFSKSYITHCQKFQPYTRDLDILTARISRRSVKISVVGRFLPYFKIVANASSQCTAPITSVSASSDEPPLSLISFRTTLDAPPPVPMLQCPELLFHIVALVARYLWFHQSGSHQPPGFLTTSLSSTRIFSPGIV